MILNANSIVQYVIQIKNGIIKHVNVNVRLLKYSKDDSWDSTTCICENNVFKKYC